MFAKGHILNKGNQYARGMRHTEEWKRAARERMKGNTHGFVKGKPSPRKGKKANKPAWNKGMKMPEMCGSNNPKWIADRTKIKLQHRRDNPLYKQWRRDVWERDGFLCRIPSKECNGRIEAHHILVWRDYPLLRFEVSNGITLCHFHHPRRKEEEDKMILLFKSIIATTISHSS